MKKHFYLILLSGLLFACSGNKNQTENSEKEVEEKIEAIEKSTQELNESMDSSQKKFEENQRKIDSLLKNI